MAEIINLGQSGIMMSKGEQLTKVFPVELTERIETAHENRLNMHRKSVRKKINSEEELTDLAKHENRLNFLKNIKDRNWTVQMEDAPCNQRTVMKKLHYEEKAQSRQKYKQSRIPTKTAGLTPR